MTIVDRALLRAWLGPFLVSLLALLSLLLLGHIRKLTAAVLGAGLRTDDIVRVLGALVPPLLVFALPLAQLTAVVFTLGRWADDGELTALRAAGACPASIVRTLIIAGLVLTGIGLPLAHRAMPAGWRSLEHRLSQLAVRNVAATLDGESVHQLAGRTVDARSVAPGSLADLIVIDGRSSVVVAEQARLTAVDRVIEVELRRGEVHPLVDTATGAYHRGRFDRARLAISPVRALQTRTRMVSRLGRFSTAELHRRAARTDQAQERAKLLKMAARRSALPALSAIFSVIGAAIAFGAARFRWWRALAVAFGYFVAMRGGDAIAVILAERMNPTALSTATIVWLPHVVLLAGGAIALKRAGQPR